MKLYKPVGNKTFWPIGSVYMSVNSTSPATLFGGTWSQITGYYLYAGTGGTTGGSNTTGGPSKDYTGGPSSDSTSTVYLTVDQIPSHNHATWLRDQNATSSQGYSYMVDTWGTGGWSYGWAPGMGAAGSNIMMTSSSGGDGGHYHTLNSHTHSLSSHTHSCTPSRYELYVWYRTA